MLAGSTLKFRIGLIFFIILVITVLGLTFFIRHKQTSNTGVFQVYTIYKTSYGLQAGYKVRYNGIVVGQIDAIDLISDTALRINISIDTSYRHFMREDVIASIGSDGLMGDNLLDINAGSPTKPLLEPGARILAKQPVDYSKILKRVQGIGGKMASLAPEFKEISDRFSHGNGSIAQLLNNTTMKSQLKSTVKTARKSILRVKQSVSAK